MVTADGGGSNGYRVWLWKIELQKLANELKFPITVCHLPPGTSKWNKIEHRLFSLITINWRGKPLRSYRTIIQLIALKVRAELDENRYPKVCAFPTISSPPSISFPMTSTESGTTLSLQSAGNQNDDRLLIS
jgi:hypothetical protein